MLGQNRVAYQKSASWDLPKWVKTILHIVLTLSVMEPLKTAMYVLIELYWCTL